MSTSPKCIVMLGMHPESKEKGGIASVVQVYRMAGLFTRWPICYVGTVTSGSVLSKCRIFLAALLGYLRLLVSGRIALVHAQTASRASFWRKSIFMAIALAARKPIVLHLHGAQFDRFYRLECGALRRRLVRSILKRADRVIVLSSQWKAMLSEIVPEANVITIPNPVVLPPSVMAEEREPCTLLFLGRIGHRKGVYDLLQALSVVRTRFPQVRLRCGGDGDVAGLLARTRELRLEEAVQFIGWVSGTDKQRELSSATIYVLPSYAEGLPMGVLEAMAAGMPIVTSRVGGTPDAIVDGAEGFLIDPGDVDALADRIMRLLGSRELRAEFASAARNKAQRLFSVEKVLAQLEDLYATLGAKPVEPKRHDEQIGTSWVRTQE